MFFKAMNKLKFKEFSLLAYKKINANKTNDFANKTLFDFYLFSSDKIIIFFKIPHFITKKKTYKTSNLQFKMCCWLAKFYVWYINETKPKN